MSDTIGDSNDEGVTNIGIKIVMPKNRWVFQAHLTRCSGKLILLGAKVIHFIDVSDIYFFT